MEYLVADYYPHFTCKCGDCRRSCCHGWPVTISKTEYERLRTADCSPEYRAKLDGALNLSRGYGVDEKSYAHIVHDKYGRCCLLRSDGLCGLQLELGSDILPDVCRLYPRNTRSAAGVNECACAASCEAVVERLLRHTEPLALVNMQLEEAPKFAINMTEAQHDRCMEAIHLIQDRKKPLQARFAVLGQALFQFSEEPSPQSGEAALRILHAMTEFYSGKSKVAGPICSETLRAYGIDDRERLTDWELEELADRYQKAAALARKRLPDWETSLERLLVNHMFFNSFPHIGGTDDGVQALYGLCVTAAFVQFVLFACLSQRETEEETVDILAELFRLIEHSDLKYRAAHIYREFARSFPGTWRTLVSF